MKKLKDTIEVRGASGKKLGEIRAWTGIGDLFDKTEYGMDSLGWMTEKGPSFKDSDDAILSWAWRQVISVLKNTDDSQNGNAPYLCLMCGSKTINFIRKWKWDKDKFLGIACANKECKMYNVLIPAEMFFHLKDIPLNKLSE